MDKYIANHLSKSLAITQAIYSDGKTIGQIKSVSELIIAAYRRENKTIFAGNGGSASDAQHLACEFVSRFYFDRPGLASIALSINTSILTAIGNDYGYEQLFSRQVQANGRQGDVFIGISTSGNSKNIVEALKACREKGIVTVGFSGEAEGAMDQFCDYSIKAPSRETPRIQEAHILIGHIICAAVEESLFGKGF